METLDTEKIWSEVLDAWDELIIDEKATKALVSLRLGKIFGLLFALGDYSLFGQFWENGIKSLRRQKEGNKHLLDMFSSEIQQAEERERWARDLLRDVSQSIHRKELLRLVGLITPLPEFDISEN